MRFFKEPFSQKWKALQYINRKRNKVTYIHDNERNTPIFPHLPVLCVWFQQDLLIKVKKLTNNGPKLRERTKVSQQNFSNVRHCWSDGRCTKHCRSASNTETSDVFRVLELFSSNFFGFEPRSRFSPSVSRPSFLISPFTPGMLLSESMCHK